MPDNDGFPTLDELKISRDSDGEINPEEGQTPSGRDIIIKPMPTGDNEKYFGNLDDPTKADYETKAQVLREFYVKPDFAGNEEDNDEIMADDVENNFDRATINDYLVGLMLYSGYMRTRDQDSDVNLEAGGIKNNP
jgi:hypothetical protein